MSQAVAHGMTHPIHRVEHFVIVALYTLALRFEDGTEQRIDFLPVLEGEIFESLRNPGVFNAVSLDKEVGAQPTLLDPAGIDTGQSA